MNDPKRLLEEGTTELERSLLSAVSAEQPSHEHRMRVREAMGIDAAPPASGVTTTDPNAMAKTETTNAASVLAFLVGMPTTVRRSPLQSANLSAGARTRV